MDNGTHALVDRVLNEDREWTVQGLGMMRTYLGEDREWRLHIWNPDLRVENVSELHTHPWDLKSFVLAGGVRNVLYLEVAKSYGDPTMRQRILCGEGGGLEGDPEEVFLAEIDREYMGQGDMYAQTHEMIHRSIPDPGTVTLIHRSVPPGGHPDYAYVYWPAGEEWVSAEPRPATEKEVRSTLDLAKGLFG